MSKVTVGGGGIDDVAIAEFVVRKGTSLRVVEKESLIAAHQIGRNSGVIHALPYFNRVL